MASPADAGVLPWVLSGRGAEALRAQAGRLAAFVAGAPDLARQTSGSRSRAARRSRIVRWCWGRTGRSCSGGLGALLGGEPAGNVLSGVARGGTVAFLFTGQGAQRVGMGRELYGAFPVFARAFDEACGHLDEHLGRSLRGVVFGEGQAGAGSPGGELDETAFTQAGLFALEVALYRLVESVGVRPDFVGGHSVGELVAAHVAGVFSLQDACRLVAARGRLMGALPAGGAMVSVQASEEEARESLAGASAERVALAAVNGPAAVVLSGEEDDVLALAAEWERRGRKTKRLRVSHAFHSPRMDAMLDEFAEVARSVSYAAPAIPVVSNLTGAGAAPRSCARAEYWVEHVRGTVRFADGARWLYGQGVRSFLELGPDGVLSGMVHECLAGEERVEGENEPAAAPLLRAGHAETRTLLSALAEAWVRGVEVGWSEVFGGWAPGGWSCRATPSNVSATGWFRRKSGRVRPAGRIWPRPASGGRWSVKTPTPWRPWGSPTGVSGLRWRRCCRCSRRGGGDRPASRPWTGGATGCGGGPAQPSGVGARGRVAARGPGRPVRGGAVRGRRPGARGARRAGGGARGRRGRRGSRRAGRAAAGAGGRRARRGALAAGVGRGP